MSADTKSVDVLAVLDDAIADYADCRFTDRHGTGPGLIAARAAIAELIAADAEFDKARDGYNPLYAKRDQLDRYKTAENRRAAAIARVKGGAK